jgi:GT2 family glycosyltransferase
MSSPTITAITVNYNERAGTMELLDSLAKQAYDHLHVVIVDNSSDPGKSIKKEDHPLNPQIIYADNHGYAAALNIGLQHTKGDYILLLNNDICLEDHTLQGLLFLLEENKHLDAVSPVILKKNDHEVEYSGYTPINRFTGRNRALTDVPPLPYRKTPYLHGACMFLRRQVLQATPIIPEIYFLYYEEMEWSAEIRRGGFELGVALNCRIYHTQSLSTSQLLGHRYYLLTRNRILFMRRQHTGWEFFIFICYFILISTPVNLFRNIAHGNFSQMKDWLRAIHWNLADKN